jgi:putative aminopeptidase FrvX
LCTYDTAVADRLTQIACDLEMSPQTAVLGSFESDASRAKANGLSARAGMLCVPTLSTHGYEVIRRQAIPEMAAIVVEFLLRGR